MFSYPLLSLAIFFPIIGVLVILFFFNNEESHFKSIKKIALVTSLVTFMISITIWKDFNHNISTFQFIEYIEWFSGYNIAYHVGVDGISLYLILLTTLLTPICILASWNSIKYRVKEYVIAFLLLESLIIGVFCALDLMLFYLFFEFMLIPMFLIIGIWGGQNRIYATFKFFLYTIFGSLFLLIAIIFIYNEAETLNILELKNIMVEFNLTTQIYLWLAFFISFAVKVPMWPFHTWLPDAHVQAPTAGSVILAGVLLKMGAYGFIRFSLPLMPLASQYFAPYIFILSIIAIIYASFVALVQKDMKKMIAYSSVAHMGYVTLGIFSLNVQGIVAAMIQVLSHGLVSAALFLCVGVLYDRMHTKEINQYGGVVNKMPKFALIFLFFTLASIGLPGTSGFIGEFLVLLSIFQIDKFYAFLAASGMVLGAGYMLWLYKRVMFGNITNSKVNNLADLSLLEIIIFGPLVILTIYIGIYPSFITDILVVPVGNILTSSFIK